jgi:hypothetical protein
MRGLRRREKSSLVVTQEFDKVTLAYLIPVENTVMYRRSRPWEVLDNR